MSYLLIDRGNSKIIKVAAHKNELSKEVIIVNSRKIESVLTAKEIKRIYVNFTGKRNGSNAHKISEDLITLVEGDSKALLTVNRCKAIFASMAGATRQEVLKAAREAGINLNTASTQFYKWVKAEQGLHT